MNELIQNSDMELPLSEKTIDQLACPRVLVVEDELKLLNHLRDLFLEEQFSAFTCSSFGELETFLKLPVKAADVIVLDRLLHGRDAATLMEKIKRQLPSSRVLVLSAINTPAEKKALLDLGADDYVAKPFDSDELVARVRALLRRSVKTVVVGNVELDSEKRSLLVNGVSVTLQNKEFFLLRTLIESPGQVFSKSFLYQRVWEMSADVESNVIEATVNKLRRRLEEAGASITIKNARNLGYWVEK
jgi:DNA-binding response OmpR family regulator